jgi:hypothetical protein
MYENVFHNEINVFCLRILVSLCYCCQNYHIIFVCKHNQDIKRNKVLSDSPPPSWCSTPAPSVSTWRRSSQCGLLYRSIVSVRHLRRAVKVRGFCLKEAAQAGGCVDGWWPVQARSSLGSGGHRRRVLGQGQRNSGCSPSQRTIGDASISSVRGPVCILPASYILFRCTCICTSLCTESLSLTSIQVCFDKKDIKRSMTSRGLRRSFGPDVFSEIGRANTK